MNRYQILCKDLGVDNVLHHELKIALTHQSFDSHHNGSRYVFLGQTHFKGIVAKRIFDFVPGKGTQIQHFLGNLFKNKYLEQIFAKHNMQHLIRYGADFDWEKHRHIFVYGLLGFVASHADAEQLQRFIFKEILEDKNHLMPQDNAIKKDHKTQVNHLCKQFYDKKPKLDITKKEDVYVFTLYIGGKLYKTIESKSYKYAHKKIWKATLRKLSEENHEKLLTDNSYLRLIADKEKLQKDKEDALRKQRLQAYFYKRKLRSLEIKEGKRLRKVEEKEKLKERRNARKRSISKREQELERLRIEKEGLKNISSKKRRILEDRGILKKRKR